MIHLQIAANGLVLGGLYACIAVGFSLVWGVLNVINILHGSFIVLGFYIAYFCYTMLGIHPFVSVVTSAIVLGAIIAPPAPWSTRMAISHSMDGDMPPRNDATVNTPTPARNTRRLPRMSPARAASSSSPANVRR